jgi:WD40 repeat protein
MGLVLLLVLMAFRVPGPLCVGQQPWAVLRGEGAAVGAVAFSSDSKVIATAGADGRVDLWEAISGRRRATFREHRDRIVALAFSSDGTFLSAVCKDGAVTLWDLRTSKVRSTLPVHEDRVAPFGLSPNGKLLVSGGPQNTVRLWDTATGKQKFQRPFEGLRSVVFSPDGKRLAVGQPGSIKRLVQVWAVGTMQESYSFEWRKLPHFYTKSSIVYACACNLGLAFSPDGKLIASCGTIAHQKGFSGEVWVWDTATSKQTATLKMRAEVVCTVAFSPDGKLLAAAGGPVHLKDVEPNDPRGEVCLFEVATGKQKAAFGGHVGSVHTVSFCPNGRLLATGGEDGAVCLWDVPAVLKAAK